METHILKRYLLFLVFMAHGLFAVSQTVPMGVSYQAVARDNYGKELSNKEIDVRFSVLSVNPQGTLVYQELHSNIITSKYGVFNLVIGKGDPTGGTASELSEINWESANHYLKVEIKFENDFLDMGTMQFLAVPYALYAKKSLEPGPQGPQGTQGPKGDPGNPATDDQTLSFDESNLSISGGNSLPLTGLLQNLTVTNQADGTYLGITRGNSVKLATIEADGDPKNELQDLTISSDKLKITNNALATEWDLAPYRDNTDNQALTYNPGTRVLGITGNAGTIDLTELENDADASVTNEIQDLSLTSNTLTITNNASATPINLAPYLDDTDDQTLTYNADDNSLTITNGSPISLGSLIAFRVGINSSYNLANNTPVSLIFDQVTGTYYNEGNNYNSGTGVFQAPFTGIYSFFVSMNLPTGASSVIIKLNGVNYETIIGPTTASGFFRAAALTMKLNKNDIINVDLMQSNGFSISPYIISGSFSGFRVY